MKNLIKNVALVLGDKQSFLCLENDDEELTTEISTYVTLANFVIKDIAANFQCFVAEEKILSNAESKINLEQLSHQPCTIKKIKNFFDKSINYSVLVDQIVVPTANEQYVIEYTYFPFDAELESDIELPLGLDRTTICYGIVSEYYKLKMMFAESDVWEQKFKSRLRLLIKRFSGKFFMFRGL